MAKLDDFLTKKKETAPVLDLFRATAKSPEEFKKLFDKLPEFKIKPEKVRAEELRIREKNFKFKSGKRDMKVLKQSYAFLDPLPTEMKGANIEELAAVPIEWKMLTLLRPKTKTEEEFFSRLVELRKLSMKTAAQDRRSYGIDPQIKKTKNKAGVVEMKVVACKECGDEFCTGEWCIQFSYDSFVRVDVDDAIRSPTKSTNVVSTQALKMKKKTNRRSRSTTKSSRSKLRKKAKSKSPVKSPSKGARKGRSKSPIKQLKKSKSLDDLPQRTTSKTSPEKTTKKSNVKKSKITKKVKVSKK